MTNATDEKPKRKKREPYIALEFGAIEDARKAALKAGVHEDVVLAGLPRLYQHCWRKKTDRVKAEDLGLFFTAADERLRRALASTGLTEIDGDPAGDRVKGAARLLRISTSKAKGGHAAKGNLLRGSARPDPVPAYAGDGPGILPADARLLQPAASSQQPALHPPTPLASEGDGSGTRSRRRQRDREPPPPDPPKPLGWTTATPQGRAWRERLDQLGRQGATYAVSVLERLRPIELAEAGALVVTADDSFFATWCRENYAQLLEPHHVLIVVHPNGQAPPQLRVLEGGGGASA